MMVVGEHDAVCCCCSWCPDSDSSKEMVRVTFPMIFDVTTEYLADMVRLYIRTVKI